MPSVEGLGARKASLRMLDAVLRKGQTLDNAAAASTRDLSPPDRALALAIAGETLRRLRPRVLAIEVKDVVMARGPGDEAALHALLADCGYVSHGQPERHVEVFRPAA